MQSTQRNPGKRENVLKNKNVLLVVMAFEDEKSYYYETKTSTKSNLKIKFELQEVTKDYINNRLQIIN